MKKTILLLSVASLVLFVINTSCKKDDNSDVPEHGTIMLVFTQYCDGSPLEYDTMKYTNAAGNHYQVSEIQYFVSDVVFHKTDGDSMLVDDEKEIHYVDTDLPETQYWEIADPVEPGEYSKVAFTFGICEEKNQSMLFVNPPERDMFWPENIGGGYHYMKLNGKWLADDGSVKPFNFHLGIGQIYAGGVINVDSITGFVQNYFTVELPGSDFTIAAGDTLSFEIRMNVENWFQHPNVWDHNSWGGMIMQNQEAMHQACENGKEDAFGFEEVIFLYPTK